MAGRTDRAEGMVAAPVAAVFAAWTDPAVLVRWLPPAGMTGRVAALDPRPGGPFRIVLTYADPAIAGKSGGGEDVIAGRFVAVDPPRHIAFVSRFASNDPQIQGEMRMDWHFDAVGQGTRVRIVATDVPPGIGADDHAAGMGASLAQLAALFTRKSVRKR
jgi:uncharacterized protein YndB with AHSA1/START domain